MSPHSAKDGSSHCLLFTVPLDFQPFTKFNMNVNYLGIWLNHILI